MPQTDTEKGQRDPISRGREKRESLNKDYSIATHDGCAKRRSRRKPYLAWEQANLASNGFYARNLADLEKKFPKLTPMQCRVCALVKAGLPSWRIAELFVLSERTIENHRHNAHVAIGCDAFERLEEVLR